MKSLLWELDDPHLPHPCDGQGRWQWWLLILSTSGRRKRPKIEDSSSAITCQSQARLPVSPLPWFNPFLTWCSPRSLSLASTALYHSSNTLHLLPSPPLSQPYHVFFLPTFLYINFRETSSEPMFGNARWNSSRLTVLRCIIADENVSMHLC